MSPMSALCIALALAASPQAIAQAPAPLGAELAKWAGPGAPEKGFQPDRLTAFLQARTADPKAAGTAPWQGWLEGLAAAGSPSLKAWALSRLAEAGVETAYAALEKAAHTHLKQLQYSQDLEKDAKLVLDPPPLAGAPLPGALRLAAGSPLVARLEARIRARKERDVTVPEFALLAYNTHPGQYPLIQELAAQISSRPDSAETAFMVRESRTLQGGSQNYLNDPRLWLLMDWAAVWGNDGQRFELTKVVAPRYLDWFRSLLYSMQIHPLVAGRTDADPAWSGRPVSAPVFRSGKGCGPLVEAQKAIGFEGPLGAAVPGYALSWYTVASADLLLGPAGSVRALRLHPGPWIGNYAGILGGTAARWRFPAGADGRVVQVSVPFFKFDQAGEREIRAWRSGWILAQD